MVLTAARLARQLAKLPPDTVIRIRTPVPNGSQTNPAVTNIVRVDGVQEVHFTRRPGRPQRVVA